MGKGGPEIKVKYHYHTTLVPVSERTENITPCRDLHINVGHFSIVHGIKEADATHRSIADVLIHASTM